MSTPYVRPYTWDPDLPTRREGVRIRQGERFMFVAWEHVISVADQLVDAHEKHEREQQ